MPRPTTLKALVERDVTTRIDQVTACNNEMVDSREEKFSTLAHLSNPRPSRMH